MWPSRSIPPHWWQARLLWILLVEVTLTWANGAGLFVLEGSQTSYAQFRQWHGGQNDTLTFEFATSQKDALLLYSDNNQEKEYVQIKLVNGNVMLRYECFQYSFWSSEARPHQMTILWNVMICEKPL